MTIMVHTRMMVKLAAKPARVAGLSLFFKQDADRPVKEQQEQANGPGIIK